MASTSLPLMYPGLPQITLTIGANGPEGSRNKPAKRKACEEVSSYLNPGSN